MLRFVRTLALAMAGLGAAAGPATLVEMVQSPAQAQTVQAEGSRAAKSSKSARRPAKSEAAEGETEPKPIDAEAVLDKARRALAEGKAETAFGLADSVIKNAKKDPRNTARALAVRGEAHLRQGRPAEALADLDSALWVKGGLAGAEREGATSARAQAMQQSGLTADAAGAAASGPSHRVANSGNGAAETSGSGSRSNATAETPTSGGIGGFFSGIFGGGSSTQPKSESAKPPPFTTATSSPARPVQPSVSSSEPQRVEGAAKPRAVAPATPGRAATAIVAPAPPPSPAAGGYRIQLAAVRSRPEAEAMAQSVRKEQAGVLSKRSFEVIEEVYGNMGRFYRVRIGSFDHPTEAMAICATLREKAIDCMMLEQ